jgi:hypothetical protein
MKKAIISLCAVLLVSTTLISCSNKSNDSSNKSSTTLWIEKPMEAVEAGQVTANATLLPFDLKKVITEADYVFQGTIVNRKEFAVSWNDTNGEAWGPFVSSVIEVKVKKEFYGTSPVSGGTIRVSYPFSLSDVFENSVYLKDNGEYIFISKALDKEYVDYVKKYAPDDKFESEKYADVYIGNSWDRVFPIEQGKVICYNEYFSYNDTLTKSIVPYQEITTDKLATPQLLESGYFIAFNESNFEKAFTELFKTPEHLPSAADMDRMQTEENNNIPSTYNTLLEGEIIPFLEP